METVIGRPRPRSQSRLGSALTGTFWSAVATLRLGLRTVPAAPALMAIAILPEFAQHAAEVHLGMYDSRAAFRAAGDDPLRWAFAYPKIAGFVLAILLVARFQALGSVREALLIGGGNLLRLGFAIGLTLVAELPFDRLKSMIEPPEIDIALALVSGLIQAGLLVYIVGALLDDRTNSLRGAFTVRWPTALLMTFLAALVFVPAQALHTGNHVAAFGQPAPIVWGLMLFDSLWVGIMAACLGTALAVGYAAGPRWRGWTERPGRAFTAGRPRPAASSAPATFP
ncbi:hypothetical protein C7I55_11435 [Sphingomonas deserti]|uniref:Uncharacterized protein n=2 Tax=Allosphingosinicella deserti TaxID=2116704 RepID=A0A2P7QSH2_9SPHN|nr:hypothetical protein C7I55_11435 [Sphingomonas deserti]